MRPFSRLIGLTGGITSGKSNARRVLGELGAVCVDADKLGHAAYRSGTDCFRSVVAAFGEDVVGEDGAWPGRVPRRAARGVTRRPGPQARSTAVVSGRACLRTGARWRN